MKKTILHLNLHRQYFDQIAEGKKKYEYRKKTPYWKRRLEGRTFERVYFRNGYATKAPFMEVQFRGICVHGRGRGAVYVIRLGRILNIRNRKKPVC